MGGEKVVMSSEEAEIMLLAGLQFSVRTLTLASRERSVVTSSQKKAGLKGG